ncbi:hypothetical protein [Sphingobacterium cavernae]|uniref:hypothetical protein n=1 Tax=Sphingobacterium cavernae TaxID=2592657 RepID=UPI00122FE213|nr:hypothetical protein [Sphingobacterium cavernae]
MRNLISILLALTIFSCVDVHAQSVRRIYVSKDGNDKNSGTVEKPLGTIHKGICQVSFSK